MTDDVESDTNDLFDDILLSEDRAAERGFKTGYVDGKEAGEEEGLKIGVKNGFEIGLELGLCLADAKSILNSDSSDENSKRVASELIELIDQIKSADVEKDVFVDTLEIIRSKKKLFAAVTRSFREPKHEDLSF
jgi:flagellar biosynthesis/type III secretory pathway protein FliH